MAQGEPCHVGSYYGRPLQSARHPLPLLSPHAPDSPVTRSESARAIPRNTRQNQKPKLSSAANVRRCAPPADTTANFQSAASGSPFESKPLEPVAASRIGKISGQCPSPPSPVLWPEKRKNRAQSVEPPAAPNSFRYGRSTVQHFQLRKRRIGRAPPGTTPTGSGLRSTREEIKNGRGSR